MEDRPNNWGPDQESEANTAWGLVLVTVILLIGALLINVVQRDNEDDRKVKTKRTTTTTTYGQFLIPPVSITAPTTTTLPPTTTTVAPPTTTTTQAAVRAASAAPAVVVAPTTTTTAAPPPAPAQGGQQRTLESTNYCLSGTMANGERVHDGAVAFNSSEWSRYKGTTWRIISSGDPQQRHVGRTFTVKDHGPGAHFDIWTPSCGAATNYGRQTVTIERVG